MHPLLSLFFKMILPLALTLYSLPLSLASLTERGACNADNCLRAVTGTAKGPSQVSTARSDCSSFLATSVSASATYVCLASSLQRYSIGLTATWLLLKQNLLTTSHTKQRRIIVLRPHMSRQSRSRFLQAAFSNAMLLPKPPQRLPVIPLSRQFQNMHQLALVPFAILVHALAGASTPLRLLCLPR